jgi:hypothetical protein
MRRLRSVTATVLFTLATAEICEPLTAHCSDGQ